jgi:hypothetical protein
MASLFGSSSINDSPSINDSSSINESGSILQSSIFDDSSSMTPSTDYGVNPTTGLPMMNSAVDVGGHMFCEQPSMFDNSSSCSSFDSDIGSSCDFGSNSSMFDD